MASVVVVDIVNSLLEAQLNSMFRFVEESSPYLGRASAEIRRPLHEMVEMTGRHAVELAEMVESLGGTPAPRSIKPEEQYLAYLSLKFLLPKLVEETGLTLQRYRNAITSLPDAPAEVLDLLNRHLAEHQAQLEVLKKAAADVAAGR